MEKRRGLALDPVGNFHIRNGASVFRINWMGDTSVKGIEQSWGLMVNYMYILDKIEQNNHTYLLDGSISVVHGTPDEATRNAAEWVIENGGNVRLVERT